MARQFIYHMQGLTKTYPGNRKVLEDIHLQFYPDAKIGVLGVNGSGKSTLLRIMAGISAANNARIAPKSLMSPSLKRRLFVRLTGSLSALPRAATLATSPRLPDNRERQEQQ